MTVHTKYEQILFRTHPRPPIVLPPPCPFCGAQEQIVGGVVRQIEHDYSKHPGLERRGGAA